MNGAGQREDCTMPGARNGRVSGEDSRFTRLRLKNWKNFVNVDVPLARRTSAIGPNAVGKSKFLHAFRLLHDLVAVGGGLQGAVQHRHGVSAIRSLAARRDPELSLEVTLGNHADDNAWRYELRFKKDRGGTAVITRESTWHGDKRVFTRPDKEDQRDAQRLTETYSEQTVSIATTEQLHVRSTR